MINKNNFYKLLFFKFFIILLGNTILLLFYLEIQFFSIMREKQHPSNDHHFSCSQIQILFQTLQFFSGHPIFVHYNLKTCILSIRSLHEDGAALQERQMRGQKYVLRRERRLPRRIWRAYDMYLRGVPEINVTGTIVRRCTPLSGQNRRIARDVPLQRFQLQMQNVS